MKHRIGYNRLGRKASHRKALLRNLAIQLFRHERIKTTKSKALEARKFAEKLITRARDDSVHNRRIVAKFIHDKEILAKLFTDIALRYLERPGGYTRILKLGQRQGDAAEMVLLELVEQGNSEPEGRRRRKRTPAKVQVEPGEDAAEEELAKDPVETPEESADDSAPAEESVGESTEDGSSTLETQEPAAEEGAPKEMPPVE